MLTKKASETARALCEGYYDHSYPIGRKEARDHLGLNVEDMPEELWGKSLGACLGLRPDDVGPNALPELIETSDNFEIDHWGQSENEEETRS